MFLDGRKRSATRPPNRNRGVVGGRSSQPDQSRHGEPRPVVVGHPPVRHPSTDHPATRTHLIGSLIDQAETEQTTEITRLVDHGYTRIEIAILIGLG